MADIKELEKYAMEHGIPIIQDEGLKLLKQKIIEYDCHSFLEIYNLPYTIFLLSLFSSCLFQLLFVLLLLVYSVMKCL